MLEKKKKYTYEELKKIYDEVKGEVLLNPFGSNQDYADKELDKKTTFVVSMTAIPIICTIEEKLFGKEK